MGQLQGCHAGILPARLEVNFSLINSLKISNLPFFVHKMIGQTYGETSQTKETMRFHFTFA